MQALLIRISECFDFRFDLTCVEGMAMAVRPAKGK